MPSVASTVLTSNVVPEQPGPEPVAVVLTAKTPASATWQIGIVVVGSLFCAHDGVSRMPLSYGVPIRPQTFESPGALQMPM
jgi:hypothetical protein